jgi:phospholipase D1/2
MSIIALTAASGCSDRPPVPLQQIEKEEDMADSHLKTQNPVDVGIDEAGRTAKGSVQWLLEDKKETGFKAPPSTLGNRLDFMICGQEGFASIAKDLSEAQETVDLICWGFDPGMELVRKPGKWKRGETYGELLERITTRKDKPVTVRLLIWYDPVASAKQNNMPGYTDQGSWNPLAKTVGGSSPYNDVGRDKDCVAWWARNLPNGSGSGKNPRLQIVLRSIDKKDVQQALTSEEDKPAYQWGSPVDETGLLEGYPTHHQKPVLIDYAYDGGSKAVGYVMGLNSVTDFWDTTEHTLDDPLRETWSNARTGDERKHETATQKLASTATYRHTKPYQDYACRVVGPALQQLHENFVNGWNAFAGKLRLTADPTVKPPNLPTLPANPAHKVQIVRTQPHEHEKTIKALYFQATSYARNYIYIENQYFFYPEFVRNLKGERKKFCDAWARLSRKPMMEVPSLHLFIVIPHPEDDGMVPRTFDMLTELGASSTMPEQGKYVDGGKLDQDYPDAHEGAKGNKVLNRPDLKELQTTFGLKVSVARLRTSGADANGKMAYREIYIHSKLMLIDDVFVTLGSANLNQRSMAVDSEINIAATGLEWASGLRQRVFELHSGGVTSGTGDRARMPHVFDQWEGRMAANRDIQKEGVANLRGFLLPFEDHRATTTMHASVTLPSSSNTALA